MPEHVDISDPEIHEIKGASTASANTVPVADGSGSHSWSKVGASSVDTASFFNANKFHLTVEIPDVSAVDTILVPFPVACTLVRITSILHGTIATADADIDFTNSTGPVSMGTLTITASGSAEGDIDQLVVGSNNAFTAGSYLKIENIGDSTNAVRVILFLECTRTA